MKYLSKYFGKDILVCSLLLVFLAHHILEMVYPFLSTMSKLQLLIHCIFCFVTFMVIGLLRSKILNRDAAISIWLVGLLITFIALMIIDTPRESHPIYYACMVVLLYYVADILVGTFKAWVKSRPAASLVIEKEKTSITK